MVSQAILCHPSQFFSFGTDAAVMNEDQTFVCDLAHDCHQPCQNSVSVLRLGGWGKYERNGMPPTARGGSVIEFLASQWFRALLIPLITAIVVICVRWNVRRDDSKENLYEPFAVGTDLLIAAIVAVPAFLTEKVIDLQESSGGVDDAKYAADMDALSATGWLYLGVICLALIGFTLERPAKKARESGGRVKATCFGVFVPITIGAAAVSATFGLAP